MKKTFFILLSMMLSISVVAQQQIQLRSVDKAECVKSDMTSLKASFSFSTIQAQDYESERGTFSCLSLPNTVVGGNEGDPQIPVVNELIAVPFGANPRIEITSFSTTDYRLEDYGIRTLVPRQPSLRKDKNPEDVPFVYNEAAYRSTRGFRSTPMATVNVVGIMRGVQLGKMTIEPVSYDPVNNTLRVFNNIEVVVHFDGADSYATEKMLLDTYTPYFDIVYKQLFNEKAVRDAYSAHPDLYTTPVKMLVVATSDYQNSTAFQNWLTWKKQKGIAVDIYTVTSSTSSSTIQTQIKSRYNSNHPTFLVIVGDETVVPAYKTNWSCGSTYGNCINDLEYASMDGDVYHDMFMSRMSVSSTTELSNLVNKILTYEKYTMSDPTYLNNSLLVAGWDSSWTSRVGKPTIQYANNNYYNSAHGINPTVYITTSSGQTAAYNNINNVGFLNYTAHGDIQELADPEFTNSNVNSMTNNDKYLWIVANCCLTANWGNSTYKPCLGETMIRAANKGAFGYIGSIPESYWYEDYYFGVGAFSYVAQTVQTTSSTTTGMYDAAFDDTGFNTLNSMPYIGNVAVTYAHAANYQSSVTDEYYWRAYQCLGDGSVMPYLNNPAANNVSHAAQLPIGATTFTVNADAGSYVSITKNNEILGVAEVPSNGTVNVPITAVTSTGDVMIVVTRNQRQPYITTIPAVSLDGPYISVDSYIPNVALVGENTNLSITFKNTGNQATSGTTTVSLSSSSSDVSLLTYSKTFSALAANATTTVTGFSFRINNGVTLGTNVTIHYTAQNGSNSWEGDLTVTANQIFTVTASANNSSYGTVTGGGQFNYGASCTVTATPADGYMFTSWTQNGTIVSTDPEYTFNVTSNTTLVANFASGVIIGSGETTNNYLPSYNYYDYTLSEQIYTPDELGGAGSITSIAFYNAGEEKTRTYDFYMKTTTKSTFSSNTDWITVAASDKVYSGSVTMVANEWTTIIFDTPFDYDGSSNVVLVADDNSGEYSYSPHMACRVFNANGNQALYFYRDNTDLNPLSPPTSAGSYNSVLSVKNQLIITKEASSTTYYNITANANPTAGGTVTGDGRYAEGATATLTATPATGYTFTNWKKGNTVVSSNPTITFTVTEDATYVANFTLNSYTITTSVNPANAGTVTGAGTYNHGATATLTATANTGYTFTNWTKNGTQVSTNATYSFSVTEAATLVANFTPLSYVVTATAEPVEGGTVAFGGRGTRDELTYGFEDGTTQGWTVSSNDNGSTTWAIGRTGYNPSGSSSSVYTSNSGTYYVGSVYDSSNAVDDWLISPQFMLGGSMSFYIKITNTSYTDYYSVLLSTGTSAIDQFTTTLKSTTQVTSTTYTLVTVDLSSYSGQGYVAIRHTAIADQATLLVDDITIVEGEVEDGTISGTFNHGETCTLVATPNTDYHFVNWTENGNVVSTSTTYTFTVTGARDLVANFSQEQTIDEQTVEMPNGWGWWSSYIETSLNDLETALGTNGISIVSQNGAVSYLSGYGWDGTLASLDLAQMYEINVNEEIELSLNGVVANPGNHVITIHNGWNWIGYPVQQSMSVANALANLNAANGDFIKSKESFSTYSNGNWVGGLNIMQPGQGYMYYSTASSTKTFYYPTTGSKGAKANLTSENNYWTPNQAHFANNMNVLAVVELDGTEAFNDNIEVGAFVGNECRGSVRLIRVENTGRYMAFLTIHGETGEPVSFRVLDGRGEREVMETLDLRINTVIGDLSKPYVLHASSSNMVLFPNPVTKGEVFSLSMPANRELNGARVEVYDVMGNLVRTETLTGSDAKLAGLPTAGVYTIKVTDLNGNVNFTKLVVR